MPVAEGTNVRSGAGAKRWFRFRYDFATHGGAVSAITLTDAITGGAAKLPDNFEITNAWTVAITAMTSAGAATVALGYTGQAAAILAATAYNDVSWDVADDMAARAAALPKKTTADVSVLATIATAALTAGRFDVIIEGFDGV